MKTIVSTTIAAISSILVALPALADQCAYITKEQALTAVSRLNLGDTVYELCEPCGETEPTTVKINSLAAKTVDYEDFWQIYINNTGIDLAYVFIASNINSPPLNLAGVAGCSASDISPILPNNSDSL
jgi:hypothetical protein